MKRSCGCCGEPVRKTIGRRAVVYDDKGFRAAIICARCTKRAILLVTPEAAKEPRACTCGKEVATLGARCAGRLGEANAELSKANVALHRARGGAR